MAEPEVLTLAYLDAHADEAARVVETLSVVDAAALFEQMPARIGAPVLTAMRPPAAARMLAGLDETLVLALLTAAGTQAAVAVLRHIAEPQRSRLIEGLPTIAAMASRVLLGFPEDAVGAWADPEVIALPATTRAAEALERVRDGTETYLDEVHVVDAARRLTGIVALHALLRAPAGSAIGTLATPAPEVLPAMMPIDSASALRAWEHTAALPVADRGERLIGVLRHVALLQIQRERRRDRRNADNATFAGALAMGYWGVLSSLLHSAVGLLPPAKPVHPDSRP